ncbi:PREDICTED: uncharacterized protein LOC109168289 [Ipomoea nil]|uniref:uncharacterized protein LOC109168289 n=1 Tax=Ipomoea nil TaxID=35883 RepID=UPI00090146E7|nr:PREDICTED: uncharacterized protein LOC109168289 [Ipomoea nil]
MQFSLRQQVKVSYKITKSSKQRKQVSTKARASSQVALPQQPPASSQVALPQQPPASSQVALPQQPPASSQVALPQQPPDAASSQVALPQQPPASSQVALHQQLPASSQVALPQQPPASSQVALPQQPPASSQVALPQQPPASSQVAIPQQPTASSQVALPPQPLASSQVALPQQPPASSQVALPQQPLASSQVALPQQPPASSQVALPQQPPVAVDYSKYRPLNRAILAANWEEAQIFFNQHPAAIQSPLNSHLETALHIAAKVDLTLQLVVRYPDLGGHKRLGNDISALDALVLGDCSIINKHNLNFWQSFIYYCVSKAESKTIFHLITSLLPWLVGKSIVNKMVLHHQAMKLLKCLCDQLTTLNDTQVVSLAKRAVFEAASLDIWQVILNIAEALPTSVNFSNHKKQGILHIAIENRSENVFNLVCGTTNMLRTNLPHFEDINTNTLLHLAGKLAPPHKLNLVSGAALQMQRELQWFKEVKKITPFNYFQLPNKDGKTPSVVFTEEHKELKEAGEKWMKDTATSCTIAAALIVTVVFAAAITVPGGNNDKNGLPFFSNHNAFTVFAISNAASLFTSATSLLVFLSILTSRYAEQDFLYALPKRLIIGLFTLFLSIIFMMIAFSATVYLVFGQNRRGVLIMVASFACLPVTSFVLLQFPLLIDLVSSTYGRGIFDQRGFPQLPF